MGGAALNFGEKVEKSALALNKVIAECGRKMRSKWIYHIMRFNQLQSKSTVKGT